ncbi:MAG: OsmC family protein [Gammaproteobacteria bacterium]|nr:OsmC family protein [Gammaproteobacteria bacterium]
MSEHVATIRWRHEGAEMNYDTYPRDHRWEFEGGPVVPASAAPAYQGGAGCVDPEEALVAAAASCHMLTFLAIAARKKLVVASYEDRAVGHLETDAEGRLAVTRIELHPQVSFAGTTPTAADLARLHESAHRNCFIANSIRAAITVA